MQRRPSMSPAISTCATVLAGQDRAGRYRWRTRRRRDVAHAGRRTTLPRDMSAIAGATPTERKLNDELMAERRGSFVP